ncbi:MAG: 2-succinyl-5-enolpyruvyl-6-hydroxy-3-cyclohexene-1-carboxylic-acid synthase [Myxococcota bacterium]
MTQALTNGAWATTLVEGLLSGGCRDAVLSPGSRHTPIVLALHHAAQAGRVRLHTILDERTAGFFALGVARVTGAPTLLACTSGTAGSHYLPALIEASHDRLPVIALTADRPPELHGVGAPQTTTQGDFFGSHVRLAEDVGAPGPEASLEHPAAAAQRALDAALGVQPGPVHLNLPFRKPLWAPEGARAPVAVRCVRNPRSFTPDLEALDAIAERLSDTPRGVLVCGPGDIGVHGRPRTDYVADLRGQVARLADTLRWPVLVDGASCLRGARAIPGALHVGDCVARSEGLTEALTPDLILRLGQVPTSTPLRRFLAQHGKGRTVLLDATGQAHEPDGLGAHILAGDPVVTLDALTARLIARTPKADAAWRLAWSQVADSIEAHAQVTGATGPLWAGAAARLLGKTLPPGGLLHLASSLAVRAFDAFAGPTAHDVEVTSNRGVNGIDGTFATAFGQAAKSSGPVAVMLGDLAFLHDVGSLATLAASWDGPPFVCVVLDNHGGGIFDHLPIAEHPAAYEAHFVTPQRADVMRITQPLVETCLSVTSPEALHTALTEAFSRPEITVIHVPFARDVDMAQHRRFWADAALVGEEAIA